MTYFGNSKPFGLVANRINSYSITLLETMDVRIILPNLAAYGIVSHDDAGRMNAVIESHFCTSENISFDNIYEGLGSVYKRVMRALPLPIKSNNSVNSYLKM
jgi:hypothetical protein